MAETFLLRINLEDAKLDRWDGLDIETIRCFHHALIVAAPESASVALQFVKQEFQNLALSVDARQLHDVPSVLELLNAGAIRTIVSESMLKSIIANQALEDLSRLCVPLPLVQADDPPRGLFEAGSSATSLPSILVDPDTEISAVHASAERFLGAQPTKILVNLDSWDPNVYTQLVRLGATPVVDASYFTSDPQRFPKLQPASLLLQGILTSDRSDQLFATVVVDERDHCLGLVYSSHESVAEAIRTRRGVYKSRKREGLWLKGETSGDVQQLVQIGVDCDADTLLFKVRQAGDGFCHLKTETCFGDYSGLSMLEKTIKGRAASAPPGSYTQRLFNEPKLLEAKILEEANELAAATTRDEIAFEAADLLYFAVTKCVAAGVDLRAVERNLDLKSLKVSRRKGNAKPKWAQKVGLHMEPIANGSTVATAEITPASKSSGDEIEPAATDIRMKRYVVSESDPQDLKEALQRPSQRSSEQIMKTVREIITDVQIHGDEAVLKYTRRFEKATSLTSPIIRAPFPAHLMKLDEKTKAAIDTSFANIQLFHKRQEVQPMEVTTMSGVRCSRFSRAIERVGLYVPGGTAVLPSSAMMLGVPAMVAGCRKILLASPPRSDGTVTPEIVYIAHRIQAEGIVLAGGAQAIAAMAYGTESISKVDKILGPGNQFVTAAKMLVSNDTNARVAIDMPAGPSEVLVIADKTANPAFVAADLLSQAEHGPDSQVVLIAIDLHDTQLQAIEKELHDQAHALPRVEIVRGAINHSVTLCVQDVKEALQFSNEYAPEHLILQIENPDAAVKLVENAGSVFIGHWTPESVGDYSAGVNHSLPTYGYAKQYSGVNLGSFTKHITSSKLTQEGLQNLGGAVMQLAGVEGLDAHARAVSIRLATIDGTSK